MASAKAPENDAPWVTVSGDRPADGPRRFTQIFRPFLGRMLLGFFYLGATNALALVLPRLINEGIDLVEGRELERGVLPFLGLEEPRLVHAALLIIGIALVAAVARVLSRIVLFNVGRDVERDLRRDLFHHLSTLSPTYFGAHPTGDLMSRLTNDLTNVRLMAGFALLNALNAVLIFGGTLPLLVAIDAKVALFALLPFPLVMGVSQAMARLMYRRTRENQEMLGRLTSAVQENLAGQQVVRAFCQEDAEARRFAEVNDAAYDASMRLAMVRLVMFPLMGLMGALGTAIALYMGGRAIVAGEISIGDLVEFNARLLQLTWPTIALGFIISVYQRGRAGLERINEVFEAQPDIVDGKVKRPLRGAIRAEGLTVRYPGTERTALEDVRFEVAPGGVLGVVGRNASGKSTLVRALSRMMPVDRGQLFLDDVDVNDWHLLPFHEGIAVVPDDGFLFSASVRENLTFGRPDATDEEVLEAVRVADLERDVAAFPDGLETLVGERGVMLSGGQRQRVGLARALLARPRILILDDCLSAVDAETEARIVSALRQGRFSAEGAGGERARPTLVIISHRLSAVREADEILVFEEGRVIERGRHDDLLERGGRYADLWGRELLRRRLDVGASAESEEERV